MSSRSNVFVEPGTPTLDSRGSLANMKEAVGDISLSEKGSQMQWAWARMVYKVNTLSGSARFQALAMCMLGAVHAVIMGMIYAALFPRSEVFADGWGEDFDENSVVDNGDWNFLPTTRSFYKMPEGIWNAWMWMCDTGHQGNVHGIFERLMALYISGFGILYFSCVVGLIVEAVKEKMDALRKGKTAVVEKDHVVMLGWTDKSLLFIKEIIKANESEGGGVVAVLSEEDKEFVDAQVLHHFQHDLRGTKVVVRNGSRLNTPDLKKMALQTCKAVVVLSDPDEEANKADSEVMQVVLAMSGLERSGHIVAEVRDVDNEKLVKMINGEAYPIETVVSHDIIGRLMLMCVRFPGLAAVYDALLGFDGSEFYKKSWPELNGQEFDKLQSMFPDAVPIGVHNASGFKLNPEQGYKMCEGDELIVFADDNDTYSPKESANLNWEHKATPRHLSKAREPEMLLFCGWRRDLRDMILLLDSMVPPGTELHILSPLSEAVRIRALEDGGLDIDLLRNLTIKHLVGNPAVQRHLWSAPIQQYTSVLILSDQSVETNIMQSDSACLATLVLIRSFQLGQRGLNHQPSKQRSQISKPKLHKHGNTMRRLTTSGVEFWKKNPDKKMIPVVCEILDPRTQQTIRANEKFSLVSDFLQSNDMVGKILAMVAEDILVKHILDELLEANRSQLEIIKATSFVEPDETVSFFEMARRIRQQTMLLVGYIEVDFQSGGFLQPLINPPNKELPRTWTSAKCIVITESSTVSPSVVDTEPKQSGTTASNDKSQAYNMHGMSDHGVITTPADAMDVGSSQNKEHVGERLPVIHSNHESSKHASGGLEDRLNDLAEEIRLTLKYNVQIVEKLSAAEMAEQMVYQQILEMQSRLETMNSRLYNLESHAIANDHELVEDENAAM